MVWLSLAFANHGALLLAGGSTLTPTILDSIRELSGSFSSPIQVLGEDSPAQGIAASLKKFGFTDVAVAVDGTAIDKAKVLVVPELDPKRWMARFGKNPKPFVDFVDHGGVWCALGASATLAGESAFSGDERISGLALFDGIVQIDYLKKHREMPLRNAYFQTRVQLGIGLDADEWLVLRDNVIEKKVGQPQVFLREAG